jgi:hypothetical protein
MVAERTMNKEKNILPGKQKARIAPGSLFISAEVLAV